MPSQPTKRGRGRPPVGDQTKIALTAEQVAWLDSQGRPRAETIRQLIDREKEGKMTVTTTKFVEAIGRLALSDNSAEAERWERECRGLTLDLPEDEQATYTDQVERVARIMPWVH